MTLLRRKSETPPLAGMSALADSIGSNPDHEHWILALLDAIAKRLIQSQRVTIVL
jgi:hypothetical protein